MKAGDPLPLHVYLSDNNGALTIADTAAFQAAGYDLLITLDGNLITPSYTVQNINTLGLHKITLTAQEGDYEIIVTIPGAHDASPGAWIVFVDSVELSDIYAAINSGGDLTPISQQLGDQSLGNLIEGDSFNTGVLTVPLSRLSPYGLTDLTDCTISAAFRKNPAEAPIPIVATIEDAALRTISAEQVVFNPLMSLGDAVADTSDIWFLDIQVIHTPSTQVITVARYTETVLWQRDETT